MPLVLAVLVLVGVGLLAVIGRAVGVAIVAGLLALISGASTPTLSAESACRRFLNTDEQTEQQALVNIAVAEHISSSGMPLALPAVRYNCSDTPDKKLVM